jgi:hypothetical protein
MEPHRQTSQRFDNALAFNVTKDYQFYTIANVFKNGTELVHVSKAANIPEDKATDAIIITGLPMTFDKNTLKVSINGEECFPTELMQSYFATSDMHFLIGKEVIACSKTNFKHGIVIDAILNQSKEEIATQTYTMVLKEKTSDVYSVMTDVDTFTFRGSQLKVNEEQRMIPRNSSVRVNCLGMKPGSLQVTYAVTSKRWKPAHSADLIHGKVEKLEMQYAFSACVWIENLSSDVFNPQRIRIIDGASPLELVASVEHMEESASRGMTKSKAMAQTSMRSSPAAAAAAAASTTGGEQSDTFVPDRVILCDMTDPGLAIQPLDCAKILVGKANGVASPIYYSFVSLWGRSSDVFIDMRFADMQALEYISEGTPVKIYSVPQNDPFNKMLTNTGRVASSYVLPRGMIQKKEATKPLVVNTGRATDVVVTSYNVRYDETSQARDKGVVSLVISNTLPYIIMFEMRIQNNQHCVVTHKQEASSSSTTRGTIKSRDDYQYVSMAIKSDNSMEIEVTFT